MAAASARNAVRPFSNHPSARSAIRVVTYNILSPALSSPSQHIRCDEDDLDPSTRLEKAKNRIQEEVINRDAICCREVFFIIFLAFGDGSGGGKSTIMIQTYMSDLLIHTIIH